MWYPGKDRNTPSPSRQDRIGVPPPSPPPHTEQDRGTTPLLPSGNKWTLHAAAVCLLRIRRSFFLKTCISYCGFWINAMYIFFITARVRSTREGNIYIWECLSVQQWSGRTPSQVVCPIPGLGGYSVPGLGGVGGTPSQVWVGGYPCNRLARSGWWGVPRGTPGYPPTIMTGWGVPPPWLDGVPPPPIRQNSTASTCYAAGGMPLAFTQEDFLVISVIKNWKVEAYTAQNIWNKLNCKMFQRTIFCTDLPRYF